MSSEIAKQNNITIGALWPTVESINISVEENNQRIYEEIKRTPPKGRRYSSSDVCDFSFQCINPGCTSKNIDLFEFVSNMVQQHKTNENGDKECNGRTGKFYKTSCGSVLTYVINITYRDA